MSLLKISKSLKTPTNTHSPSFPPLPSQASQGYRISGKEIEVHSLPWLQIPPSNLCLAGRPPKVPTTISFLDLQFLIQNHMAPSHSVPAESFYPFSSCMVSHCPASCIVSPAFFQNTKREFCMADTSCFPDS